MKNVSTVMPPSHLELGDFACARFDSQSLLVEKRKSKLMKPYSICLMAASLLVFFSGCAAEDAGYSPSQIAAQHSEYDPTGRLSAQRY